MALTSLDQKRLGTPMIKRQLRPGRATDGGAGLHDHASTLANRAFLHNSLYDGKTPTLWPPRTTAIAPDKSALLPAKRLALELHELYQRINGIIIDIANLGRSNADTQRFQLRRRQCLDPNTWAPPRLRQASRSSARGESAVRTESN